jgi:hypothetical protein
MSYSMGDWIFIVGVMAVIVICVALSNLRLKK